MTMKRKIFNQYVDEVAKLFCISKDELFVKSKRRNLVDARYTLYYLCSTRPMRLKYITQFMLDNGYDIAHNNIMHGIKCMQEKVNEDNDYRLIIKRLELCVA